MHSLVTMVTAKFDELEFEYILSAIWSLGILVKGFDYYMPTDTKLNIVEAVDRAIEIPTMPSVPLLVFSISMFLGDSEVTERV